MEQIAPEQYNRIKESALLLFRNNRTVTSPVFWEIKITPEGFNHIEWKNKDHRRPPEESYIRYLCFHHLLYILNHSKLYQEFCESVEDVMIKKHGKKIKTKKIVSYYWFVAIVNNNKNRVKIVVRKVEGWKDYEFVSVIPAWKTHGYKWEFWGSMFFEENLNFLYSDCAWKKDINKKAIFKRK